MALPEEIWSDPKTWIILGPLCNDAIHGAQVDPKLLKLPDVHWFKIIANFWRI